MTFAASVLTLYPDMFPGPLGLSLAGSALEAGRWSLKVENIRDHARDRHHTVDDTPAGGGPGMVLKPDVVAAAVDAVTGPDDNRPRLLMSPRGKPFDQAMAHELAEGQGVIIVCGRFEGIDQRVIEARALREVSIGDYVLSGGEPAAIVVLDTIIRLLPGVMGDAASAMEKVSRPACSNTRTIPGHATSKVIRSPKSCYRETTLQLPAGAAARPKNSLPERRPDLMARQERKKHR